VLKIRYLLLDNVEAFRLYHKSILPPSMDLRWRSEHMSYSLPTPSKNIHGR
jgi:hypothetical protein